MRAPLGASRDGPGAGRGFGRWRWRPAGLETVRLTIRPLSLRDLRFTIRLLGDGRARRFLGGAVAPRARPRVALGYLRGGGCHVVRRRGGERVGLLFLHPHRTAGAPELSFLFDPAAWGRGFAGEAASRLRDHAHVDLGNNRLVAETQAANAASRALLERLGFVAIRRLTRFGADQVLYEWRPSAARGP